MSAMTARTTAQNITFMNITIFLGIRTRRKGRPLVEAALRGERRLLGRQDLMKPSNSSLTRSFRVVHMPCGAPL
jgi:hypothetical protein